VFFVEDVKSERCHLRNALRTGIGNDGCPDMGVLPLYA